MSETKREPLSSEEANKITQHITGQKPKIRVEHDFAARIGPGGTGAIPPITHLPMGAKGIKSPLAENAPERTSNVMQDIMELTDQIFKMSNILFANTGTVVGHFVGPLPDPALLNEEQTQSGFLYQHAAHLELIRSNIQSTQDRLMILINAIRK